MSSAVPRAYEIGDTGGHVRPFADPALPDQARRQIEANRRNAQRSTGPRTEEGKRASRANAVRHGRTAETVVGGVEDAEDYKAFEAAVITDYDARTAVERELVLRLASLLWRLRRATAVETDLLEIQAELLRDRRNGEPVPDSEDRPQYSLEHCACSLQNVHAVNVSSKTQRCGIGCDFGGRHDHAAATRRLTYCFLRLTNLDSGVFERLGRYEAALWRQSVQMLLALQSVRGDRRSV